MKFLLDAVIEDYHTGSDDDDCQTDGGFDGKGLCKSPDADEYGGNGFQDTQDGTQGGSHQFYGFDQGDVGNGGCRDGDAQDVQPGGFLTEGDPGDTSGKLAGDDEADGGKSHDVAGQGSGFHIIELFVAQADDVDGIRHHRKNGIDQSACQITLFQPDASGGEQDGPHNGEEDGTDLDPGFLLMEKEHHDCRNNQRIHEMNGGRGPAGDVLERKQQGNRRQCPEDGDEQGRQDGFLGQTERVAGQQRKNHQHQSADPPSVGQYFNGGISFVHQDDRKIRGQSEGKGGDGRQGNPYNVFSIMMMVHLSDVFWGICPTNIIKNQRACSKIARTMWRFLP